MSVSGASPVEPGIQLPMIGGTPSDAQATPRPNVYDGHGAPTVRVAVPIDPAKTELPAPVTLEGVGYFLVEHGRGFALLSSVCPHAGGQVVDTGEKFHCPNHDWSFDHSSGVCLNTPSEQLSMIPVEIEAGRLYAEVPPRGDDARRTRGQTRRALRGVTIDVHAHACLELTRNGFSLLTDPWLEGPAFLGAWTQYPPPRVKAADLRPDAIWISHEHSDHFHEPTLELFDRSIPIFVPDFPNQRLADRCRELGFDNVTAMPFGERFQIADEVFITAFEPASLWNDSIVLIEMGDLRFLNLNDAGVNHRIASIVAPVDVISLSYSQAASSYPATWQHLSEKRKEEIVTRGESGAIEMVRTAVNAYRANAVLPFASHFTLWHPIHHRYVETMGANLMTDVVEGLEAVPVRVIDALPGEQFDGSSAKVAYRPDREMWLQRATEPEYVSRVFDEDEFTRHQPADAPVTYEEIAGYLLGFNRTTEIVFSDELVATLRVTDLAYELAGPEVGFRIADARLELLDAVDAEPNLLIEIPQNVIARVIRDGLPWDEADIGYWIRFDRAPDVFHAGFWRMIHSPYYERGTGPAPTRGESIEPTSVIGELLETHGAPADRILRRYGLYCSGCRHSTAETIELGAAQHGLSNTALDRMVRELQELANGRGVA